MSSKKQKRIRNQVPRCPYCGSTTTLRSAEGIYKDNRRNTMLYVCRNYPDCDAYVRVQTGSDLPLGTMANGKLRTLRREAHQYFDQLYKRSIMTKDEAYLWLAEILAVPMNRAHIGMMGEYYCGVVIEESKKLLQHYLEKSKTRKAG